MDTQMLILFTGGAVFSLVLYLAEYFPWFIAAGSGVFSTLFLFSLGLYWIGVSSLPSMGYIFVLWAFVNMIISVILIFSSLREGRTRFD